MANTGIPTASINIRDKYKFSTLTTLSYDKEKNPASFGIGGSSDVYVGELILEGRVVPVAIKTVRGLHCQGNAEKLEALCNRFKREDIHLRNVTSIWHENIVPFYGISNWDTVEANPTPGLVSLFCKNNNVTVFLSVNPTEATKERRLDFIRDTALGLQYLHSMNMVHGDLKPGNILVKDNGRAAISDFGQARVLTRETGLTTGLHSTPQYTAPEILSQDESDNDEDGSDSVTPPPGRLTSLKGDIYSFAMTALEICSGKTPYKAENDRAIISLIPKIVKGRKPDLKGRHNEIANIPGLEAIVVQCWATDPKERPERISDVIPRLKRLPTVG